MTNEIVQFNTDTGLEVRVTSQDVKQYLCPQASDKEIAMFLELCRAQRLNPWVKDCYLVKYGNQPASIITGKETFSKRAKANPNYRGFQAGVIYADPSGAVKEREGSAVFPGIGEQLLGGWCRVYVDGMEPVYNAVTLGEYSTGKALWLSKPATMIRKVAYVQCLREAFPDDFQGMYDAAEMGQSDYKQEQGAPIDVTQEARVIADPEPVSRTLDEAQYNAMLASLGGKVAEYAELCGKTPTEVYNALAHSKTLQGMGYSGDSGDALTAEQMQAAMQVVSGWISKTVAKAEAARVERAEAEAEPVKAEEKQPYPWEVSAAEHEAEQSALNGDAEAEAMAAYDAEAAS